MLNICLKDYVEKNKVNELCFEKNLTGVERPILNKVITIRTKKSSFAYTLLEALRGKGASFLLQEGRWLHLLL